MTDNLEVKIRHLEMIQAVITRMATNSFMLKGWAVTLVSGIFVLSSKEADKLFFLIAYVPVILFWLLDTYYLQLERRFRAFYNQIRSSEETDLSFAIHAKKPDITDKTTYPRCFLSVSESCFYLPMALLIAAVIYIVK